MFCQLTGGVYQDRGERPLARMEPRSLNCSQAATDAMLMDRLSELAAIVDPVPWSVQARAGGALRRWAAELPVPVDRSGKNLAAWVGQLSQPL